MAVFYKISGKEDNSRPKLSNLNSLRFGIEHFRFSGNFPRKFLYYSFLFQNFQNFCSPEWNAPGVCMEPFGTRLDRFQTVPYKRSRSAPVQFGMIPARSLVNEALTIHLNLRTS